MGVGSDADVAIGDEGWDRTIKIGMLHDAMDYTPYEGIKVRGWPTHTISRGEVLWADEQFSAEPGRGEFLPCAKPTPARPAGQPRGMAPMTTEMSGRDLPG